MHCHARASQRSGERRSLGQSPESLLKGCFVLPEFDGKVHGSRAQLVMREQLQALVKTGLKRSSRINVYSRKAGAGGQLRRFRPLHATRCQLSIVGRIHYGSDVTRKAAPLLSI
jgi:hypothetical protein